MDMTSKSLYGADDAVARGEVRDCLVFDRVLWSANISTATAVKERRVITRGGGEGKVASDIELDVVEAEGLSATGMRSIWEICVLSGSHEPEEGDDDEVEDNSFGNALVIIFEVEDLGESTDDGGDLPGRRGWQGCLRCAWP